MAWKKFGYACCLSCGFNFVVFQVLFVHLKFGKRTVELPPDRVPTAYKACLTVGMINLAVAVLTVLYIRGILKYNPIHHVMRVLNLAGRHGPATGANRYRRFTDMVDNPELTPSTGAGYEPAAEPPAAPPTSPPSAPPSLEEVRASLSKTAQSPAERSPTARTAGQTGAQNTEAGAADGKPPFEMIDLN